MKRYELLCRFSSFTGVGKENAKVDMKEMPLSGKHIKRKESLRKSLAHFRFLLSGLEKYILWKLISSRVLSPLRKQILLRSCDEIDYNIDTISSGHSSSIDFKCLLLLNYSTLIKLRI